jgi:hypothetical protein
MAAASAHADRQVRKCGTGHRWSLKACAGVVQHMCNAHHYMANPSSWLARPDRCRWYPTPTLMTNKKVMIMVRELGKTCTVFITALMRIQPCFSAAPLYTWHLATRVHETCDVTCMQQGGTNRTNDRADSFGAWTFEVITFHSPGAAH